MGGEGRRIRLGEAADLLTGFPFKSAEYSGSSADIRLLRGDNIAQGNLRWDGVKRWPSATLDNYRDYLLRPDDVVLAMDRPWIEAGLKHATLTEADCPSLLVQRVARLRAKAGIDQRFLGYVIRSADFTNYILGVQTGTAVPHISGNQINGYEFFLPPLPQQVHATDLLGALDDKIELNRRIAKTLEAMARALFRSWFVNFDPVRAKAEGRPTGLPDDLATLFPDRFDDDGLPSGWTRQPLGELFEVSGGNTPSTVNPAFWNGPHQWATPKDLSSLASPVLLQTERQLSDAGLRQCSSGLLPRRSLLLSSRAPIGYMAFTVNPTAINQGFAGIIRKETSIAYAWGWCDANMDVIIGNAGGSTFPEISKSAFRQLLMLTPSRPVLQAFGEAEEPLIARIVASAREQETLGSLRDTLLPKLISGELRITDAEKRISAG
jgi:type I restriction enzyme S subunit